MTTNTINSNAATAIATVIAIKYSTPQPNTMKRRNGESVFYVGYSDFLEGKLVNVQVGQPDDHLRHWEFHFEQHDGSKILLTMPYYSPTALAILCRLPNIDLNAVFGVSFTSRATVFTNVEITQNGNDIAPYYLPDALNGLPPAIPIVEADGSPSLHIGRQLAYMESFVPALFLTANQIESIS
jgi:hypothetical protein